MDNTNKPWAMPQANLSHSSLRGMEIAVAPGQDLPPPDGSMVYERKPLPPVPPTRHSASSAFSREVSNAFRTPEGSIRGNWQEFRHWAREEAEIAVMLDNSVKPVKANRNPLRIYVPDRATLTDTPSDEVLSPQPKQAVPKILRLTGAARPLTSPAYSTPSGYNPQHKIRQLMGMDIGSDEYTWEPVSPVSPLTPASSTYSQDDLEATISEPDESLYTSWKDEEAGYEEGHGERELEHGGGYASDTAAAASTPTLWEAQMGYMPKSLRINKSHNASDAGRPSRHEIPSSLAPASASHHRATGPFLRFHADPKSKPQSSAHHPTLSASSVDYHISAAEIAYATGASPRKGHRSQPSASSTASSGSQYSNASLPSAKSSPDLKDSSLNRGCTAKKSEAPAQNPTATVTPFGAGQSFDTDEHPLKTPYPLKSEFEDDSDDEVSPPKKEGSHNRRRSVMDRVFKKRHRSRGSGGSHGSLGGSGSGSGESYSMAPESQTPRDAARALQRPSTSPGHASERFVLTNGAPRRANGPATPMPVVHGGGRSAFTQRTGDLMEQARAAVVVKAKDDKRRSFLRRKGTQPSEDTTRQLKSPPPVPPRPLSLVRGGEKFSGNWL